MKLYGYWRSSAAYRVRIALNLKQISAEQLSVHLVKDGGEQHSALFAALNPQELVPALVVEDNTGSEQTLTQSLAILEYLEEQYSQAPLLPCSAIEKAKVRAMAMAIACEIHPLNNLRVLQHLSSELDLDEQAKNAWYQHWVATGFTAIEKMIERDGGQFCYGDTVTLADVCLIPQVYNAKRFNVDLSPYPNIERIWQTCRTLSAFVDAAPEAQEDAVN